MQSRDGDVQLSVTLDTSGLKKETDKIKQEIQKSLKDKTQNTDIEFHVDSKSVEDATKELESLSNAAEVATGSMSTLSTTSDNMRNVANAALEAAAGVDDLRSKSNFSDVTQGVQETASEVDGLASALNSITAPAEIAGQMEETSQSVAELATNINAAAQGMSEFATASNAIGDLGSASVEANNLASSMSEVESMTSALADASASTDNMAGEAEALASAMDDTARTSSQAAVEANNLSTALKAVGDLTVALGALENLTGLPESLEAVAKALRKVSNAGSGIEENAQGIENTTEPLEELSNTADNTAEALQKVKDMFLKDTGGDLEALNQFIQAYDALPKEAKEAFDKWKESLKEIKEETKKTASAIEETQQLSSDVGKEEPRVTYLSPKEQELTRKLFGEDALSELMMIVAEKGQEAGKEFLNNLLAELKQNKQEVQEELTDEPLHYEFRLDIPNDETFTQQIQRMEEEAKSAQEELNKLTSGFKYSNEYQQVTEDVNALQKELTTANQKLADMERIGQTGTEEYEELANKAFQLEKVLEDAKAVQQDIVDDGKKYTVGVDEEAIKQMESRTNTLIQKIALLRQNIRMGSEAWKELTPQEKFSQFVYQLKNQYKELGDTILKKVIPAVQKFAKNSATAVGGALKSGLKNLTTLFKKLTPQVNGANKSLAAGLKQILGYTIGISSLLMLFNKLRAAIKEGVNNLAQWKDGNNELNKNLSTFISYMLQLKNQLAAAFMPIINIVVPILNTFIDSMIDAMNVLAQFIAKLTNQSVWIKATRVQKNYADSLKSTGKAAGDASGKLAKFDDLDVLNTKNGAGGIDPNDMFEEMPISEVEENVEGWIDKLKLAWETGDFTEIGGAIGEWLKNALANIPWGDIQNMAKKLAKSLATLLNGFFETEGLGEQIGTALAEVFTTIFTFLNKFVHTLHWDSIGTFIGNALVNFVKKFPWEEAGHALGGAFVGIITTAYNAVKTFVGQNGFTKLYMGILDGIDAFLEEMNRKPKSALKGGGEGLDGWEKLGQTIYMTLHGIMTSLTSLVKNLPIEEIMEGLTKVGKNAQVSQLVKDFFDLAEAIVQAITLALQHIANDENAKKELGHAIGAILNGIIDLGDDLAALAGVIIKLIGEALLTAVNDTAKMHPLTVDLAALISAALLGIKAAQIAPGAVAAVKDVLTYALAGGAGGLGITIGTVTILGIVTAKIGFDFGKWLGSKLFPDDEGWYLTTTMTDWITEFVIKPLWTLIAGVPTFLVEGFINGFNGQTVYTVFGPLIDLCNGIIEWIKDIFGTHSPSTVMRDIAINIVQGLINGFTEMKDKVGEVWTHIKDAIFEKVTLIKDSVMTKVDAFKLTFLGVFVEIQSKFISIWNKIKDGIKTPLNAILAGVETMVNGFIKALNKMIDAVNNLGNIKMPDWAKEKFGIGDISISLPRISEITIPRLAQGAVIPPNREFLAMLGDQTSGTNIEAPLDTITEAFAEVAGSMRGNGNAVMTLDGQTFARLVVPYVMNELDRRGYNVKVLEA